MVDAINLLLSHIGIIDLKHIKVLLLLLKSELVNADNGLSTRVNLGLPSSCALFNTHLGHAGDNGLSHAPKILNLIDDLHGLLCELIGQSLHHIATGPRVSHMGDPSFLLDYQLSVASDTSREWSWQSDCFIKGIGMQGLGSAKHGRHSFHCGSHNVVVGVLLSQRPPRGLAVSPKDAALGVGGAEILLDQLGPKHSGCSQLCNLHIEIHSHGEEEGDTRCHLVDG